MTGRGCPAGVALLQVQALLVYPRLPEALAEAPRVATMPGHLGK
jgi:hypothetical protein